MTTIKIRRDTAANWTTNSSVVLALGEPGLETDTRKIKYGDGTTTWASLPYAGVSTSFSFPGGDGTSAQVLQSNGDGTTSWSTRTSPIPSQSGNSGKYLTTDGSAVSWGTVAAGGGSPTATLYAVNGSNVGWEGYGWPSGSGQQTDNNWQLINDGGTGVTVSGKTFTLPAGTWLFEIPLGFSYNGSNIPANFKIKTTGGTIISEYPTNIFTLGNGYVYFGTWTNKFTLASSTTLALYADSQGGSWSACGGHDGTLKFTKVA